MTSRKNAGTAFIVKNGERFFIFTGEGRFDHRYPVAEEVMRKWSRAKLLEPTTIAYGA